MDCDYCEYQDVCKLKESRSATSRTCNMLNPEGKSCSTYTWDFSIMPKDVISIVAKDGILLDTVESVTFNEYEGVSIHTYSGRDFDNKDIGTIVFKSSVEAEVFLAHHSVSARIT